MTTQNAPKAIDSSESETMAAGKETDRPFTVTSTSSRNVTSPTTFKAQSISPTVSSTRSTKPPNRPYRPFRRKTTTSSTTSTTTSTPTTIIPTTVLDEDYDNQDLLNYTVSTLDLSIVREWNTTTDLNIELNDTLTSDGDSLQTPRHPSLLNSTCKQEPDPPTDPFLLFQFAQKLEQQGYENYTSTLKGLCWETSFGQELVKLTLTDLYMNIISTIFNDYLRAVLVRYCNGWPCICCDLEMRFPGYPDFAIAENILSLVNSQGLIW